MLRGWWLVREERAARDAAGGEKDPGGAGELPAVGSYPEGLLRGGTGGRYWG